MTDATIQQLTGEVDDLTRKVNDLSNLMALFMVNGLSDAFDGSGNQTFGGGVMRLDKTGIQFQQSFGDKLIVWGDRFHNPLNTSTQDLAYISGYMDAGNDGSIRMVSDLNETGGPIASVEIESNSTTRAHVNIGGALFLDYAQSTSSIVSQTLTGNTNDLDMAQYATTLHLNSDGAYNLTGVLTNLDINRVLIILNISAFIITLKNNSASSAAHSRFDIGADIVLNPAGGATFISKLGAAGERFWHCIGAHTP